MNEHDLRSAFNQLRDDVMVNVQTEDRLEQVTKTHIARHRPMTAVAAALVGAAAVVLVVGSVVLALRPGGDEAVPPATGGTSTTVVDTSAGPETTSPTTGAPTPTLPVAAPGTVLIADRGVPVLVEGDGFLAYLSDRVISDGSGGIVVQIDQRLIRMGAPEETRDLVRAEDLAADQGPVTIRLEDLARIDGVPHVLFTVSGGTFEEPFQQVWTYDLTADVAAPIYGRSEFESSIVRASLANDVLLMTIAEEGTTYLEFRDARGRPIDVNVPFAAGAGTSLQSPIVEAVLSPDGSTMVTAQLEDVTTGEGGFLTVELTLWDLVSGDETRTLEIELREGTTPARLDYDGARIVLGRVQNLIEGSVALPPVLLIDVLETESTLELDIAGVPSLVK